MEFRSIASRSLAALALIHALAGSRAAGQTKLKPYAHIESELIDEPSGIVKSRLYPEVFWTHNDSGDRARLFAIDRSGRLIQPDQFKGRYEGLEIGNALNIDWEDIATDNSGNLYIAACGNNGNRRRDLAIYVVPEPDPRLRQQIRASAQYPFAYPDQDAFPPERRNFDYEALFWGDDRLYLLTKHRSDTRTKLYRLEAPRSDAINTLFKVAEVEVGSPVTAADATSDGRLLAVLCYEDLWIFERPGDSDNYLAQPIRHRRIAAKQCEAITWIDRNELLIANEQEDMYRIFVDEIPLIKTPR